MVYLSYCPPNGIPQLFLVLRGGSLNDEYGYWYEYYGRVYEYCMMMILHLLTLVFFTTSVFHHDVQYGYGVCIHVAKSK